MDGQKQGKSKKQSNKGGSQRGRGRAAQNTRLKCNVLERERERESRACHAVKENCTLAEC